MRKNRPKVRWQVSQGTENIRDKRMWGRHLIFYILYATALSMLSLYAACLMGDQFGLSMEERCPVSLWVAAGGFLVIVAWNETVYARGKRVLRLLGNVALFIAVCWGPEWWFFIDEIKKQNWSDGMNGVALRYIERWNDYFAANLELPGVTQTMISRQQWAWVVTMVLLALILQVFSGFLRKRTVMLLLPAAVLAMGMFVGVTPRWPGMACMFAAGMLSLYLDRHRDIRPVPALLMAGLMALLLPLTAVVMERPALRVNQSHDRLQAFQHNVERGIREYDWQALFRVEQDGTVDNRQPEYEHKEIMTITVNEVPDANIYLRGYCGAEYQRGRWDNGEKAFDRACRRQGMDSGDAALLLARLCAPAGGGGMRYELGYTGMRSNQAYLPYGADPETLGEQCRICGDFVAEKPGSLKNLAFSGYAPGVLAVNDRDSWDSDAQEFYSWYNEYAAEQYLVVSGDFSALTDIVDQIVASDDYRAVWEKMQSNEAGLNEVRLALGSIVARRLQSLARYNIDPGPLPSGTDPVEYFLGENRQGYCAHFASAGALLLRRLGVPARYVTGYVVRPEQFRRSTGGYRASVRDDAAHAWVEIWLDGVGWAPVEMTPGYEETKTILAGQDERQSPLQTPPQPDELQQTPDERKEQETEASPAPTPVVYTTGQDAQTTQPGASAGGSRTPGGPQGTNEPEGWGFAGEGGWAIFGQNGSLRVSHVVLAAIGTLAAAGMTVLAVSWLRRYREARWRKIWHDIENGGARRAVRTINRRLYRRLWRKHAGMLVLNSDEEYLAALKRQYPEEDWESYLEVVRKAVYSLEEISAEAAGDCYAILKRVCVHKKSEKVKE